jgi:hypothetical protein
MSGVLGKRGLEDQLGAGSKEPRSTSERSSLLELPDELLVVLFNYLCSYDRQAFGLCNKRLQIAYRHARFRLCLSGHLDRAAAWSCWDQLVCLQNFSLKRCVRFDPSWISECPVRLPATFVKFMSLRNFSDDLIPHLRSMFPALEHLSLSALQPLTVTGITLLQSLPRLRWLKIDRCDFVHWDDAALQSLLRIPGLERLSISARTGLLTSAAWAGTACPALHSLELSLPVALDSFLPALGAACPHLASLSLSTPPSLTAMRAAVSAGLTQLQELSVSQLAPDAAEALHQLWPGLTSLTLQSCKTVDGLPCLHELPALHSLRVRSQGAAMLLTPTDVCRAGMRVLELAALRVSADSRAALEQAAQTLEELSVDVLTVVQDDAGPPLLLARARTVAIRSCVGGAIPLLRVPSAESVSVPSNLAVAAGPCVRVMHFRGAGMSHVPLPDGSGAAWPSLTEFQCHVASQRDLQLLSRHAPGLTYLDVASSPVTDDVLSTLIPRWPHLRRLVLGSSMASDQTLASVVTCCPLLDTVSLMSAALTDRGVLALALAARSRLRTLKLGHSSLSPPLSDATVLALGRLCPRLECLTLSGCAIDDDTMIAFAHGCPNLAHVDLRGCRYVTRRTSDAIAQACPLLVSVLVSGRQLESHAQALNVPFRRK